MGTRHRTQGHEQRFRGHGRVHHVQPRQVLLEAAVQRLIHRVEEHRQRLVQGHGEVAVHPDDDIGLVHAGVHGGNEVKQGLFAVGFARQVPARHQHKDCPPLAVLARPVDACWIGVPPDACMLVPTRGSIKGSRRDMACTLGVHACAEG